MLDQTSAQASAQASAARVADHVGAPGAPQAPRPAVPPTGHADAETLPGVEHLLFTCRAVPCAVPLGELRGVLRAVPPCVALPFSPPWLLGVFAHRTELLGLVDPAPLLLGATDLARDPSIPSPAATLIAGQGDQEIGLAVETLGEIVSIRSDEIVTTPAGATFETSVAPPYLRGRYQPAAGGNTGPEAGGSALTYAVVDPQPFVATLLDALREGADHA